MTWVIFNLLFILICLGIYALQSEASDLIAEDPIARLKAAKFLILEILLPPTLGHGLVVAVRVSDRGITADIPLMFKVLMGVFSFMIVLILVACFLLIDITTGIIALVAVLVVIYILVQLWMYFSNDM